MKLTKPQLELLRELGEGDQGANEEYPPARKLVEFGLAERKETRTWSYLRITDAGRAALKAEE